MNIQRKDSFTVVQLNPLGVTLSTGRTTRELHNYLLSKGVNSLIACPAPLDCDDAFFFSSRNQMRVDRVLAQITGLEGHFSRIATHRFIKYLDKVKPDIVHLRILHSNYINLKMLFSYLAKKDIATVVTMHDMWFITGGCCYYTIKNCMNWLNGCKNCGRKNHAEGNKAIRYCGVAPNSDIVKAELAATLLVNPRPTNEDYTKYSFPSKNMEYMASGTPVLTTKLPGMPEEYYPYVYLLEDESAEGMAKALKEILSQPEEELAQKGADAKNFVMEEKNNVSQARKLMDMLENIMPDAGKE